MFKVMTNFFFVFRLKLVEVPLKSATNERKIWIDYSVILKWYHLLYNAYLGCN